MGLRQWSGVGWRSLLFWAVWLLASCGDAATNEGPARGPGRLGDTCQKSEDCASLLCVRLTADSGVCSVSCEDDTACPHSDNWGCLPSANISSRVCGCLVLSDAEVCGDGIDNECNGAVDDCQMCGGESVPVSDPRHCGGCDRACRSDQWCERGACKCPVESPLECGGICTDPAIDANNCGSCGSACGPDQVCSQSQCVCPSSAAPDYCPLVGCVSLSSDPDQCGKCGTSCTLGQTCSGGNCVCPADGPQDFCDGVGCVDLQVSLSHCGECDSACVSTQTCQGGSCVCPAGQELCDGVCVDLESDVNNCGKCGEACPSALACITGSCSCSAAGYAVCGEDCAKLDSDPLHCGDCDNECGLGETCSGSNCVCLSDLYCDGECMPVDDDQNCGVCGKACPVGQTCQGGECGCVGFGLTPCGDECVSLTSDELHCGNCETECRNTEQCGGLGCACPGGQTFCDNADACVSLTSDEAHCGDCQTACDPTEVCTGSSCKCPVAGALYCASQGACTDTLSNEAHCGGCDEPCKPTELCNGGQCACPSGQTFCAKANACVDFTSDSLNCGACDDVCPADTHCSSSKCVCDTFGQTLCGDVCYDLNNDPDHCGKCDKDCGGNYSCMGGACKCPQPVLGAEVKVTSSGDNTRPIPIWDGTHVGVAFGGFIMLVYNNVRFLLLNPDGTLVANSIVDIGQNRGQYDMTWNGSEYAVVATSYNGILFRRVGADGVPLAGVDTSTANTGPWDLVQVGWSTQQGGYVTMWNGGSPESLHARSYGTDGSSLGAVQSWEQFRAYGASPMVTAPDGTIALLTRNDDPMLLTRIDPSGVHVEPDTQLDSAIGLSQRSALAYDANGYFMAWGHGQQILLNRGTTLNSPVVVTTMATPSYISDVTVAQSTSSVAVGWGEPPPTGSGRRFRFQRFTQPDGTTGAVTPITDAMDIVTGHATTPSLVSTGPYRLLAVWADGRPNDASHALYARPIDLQACP